MHHSRFTSRSSRLLVGVLLVALQGFALAAPLVSYAQVNIVYPRPPTYVDPKPPKSGNAVDAPPSVVEEEIVSEWGCSLLKGRFQGCFTGMLYGLMYFTYGFSDLTGRFLNTAVAQVVVGMSSYIGGDQPGGVALEGAWRMVRDVANIVLVFITIFLGLSMIVGSSQFGSKQLLFKIFLAALFVNFSLLLSRVVIDTSNILAISIYSQIVPAECAQLDAVNNEGCLAVGASGRFMALLKLQQLASPDSFKHPDTVKNPKELAKVHTGLQWMFLLGSIMFVVLAFVFALTGFLVVLRFFLLAFLMVLSPLGLVLWITGLSGIGRQWWHKLLNQSFFLPAMFFLWLLGLRMLTGLSSSLVGNNVNVGAAFAGIGDIGATGSGLFGLFVFFILIIGVMLFSLTLAKKMGAAGANVVINTGNAWAKKAGMMVGAGVGAGVGGATAGMAARLGRNTIGKFAADGARNDELMRQSVEGNWAQRKIAGSRLRMHDKIAGASFDARALAGKDAQKWIGAGKKGGYTQKTKDEQKRMEEMHKRLGEAKTTGEEKYARDKKLDVVESDHVAIQKGGSRAETVVQRLEQEAGDAKTKADVLSGQDEVDRAQKALNAAPDATKLKEMEEAHESLKKGSRSVADVPKLRESERKLEEARAAVSNRGTLEKQLTQAKASAQIKQNSDEYKKAQEEASLASASYDSANKYHAGNKELERLRKSGASDIEVQNQRAKLEEARLSLDKMRSQRGAAVDTEFMSKAKDRASARQEAFLNNESNRLFGRKHREFTTTLRKKTGKAARNEKMEKLFKEWKEEEEGTTSPAPAPSTTPSTPIR